MKVKGKIRTKIILVVIPILMLTSGFIGITAYLSSKNGITRIAKEFLGYQLNEVYKYASRQNETIKSMQLTNDVVLTKNAKISVGQYSKTVIKSDTSGFLAVKKSGEVEVNTLTNYAGQVLSDEIVNILKDKTSGWIESSIDNKAIVGVFIEYSDWDMIFILTEEKEVFYQNVNEIVDYLIIILSASLIISSIILTLFIARITRPINAFVKTIQTITDKMDLTRRVKIEYQDEIGVLGHYFNDMLFELEGAYNQIKNYAYQTVLAKKKEERVRFIFQKFVPQEVINQVLNLSSDTMLIGARQEVSVLFSDIRSFTTISENMRPEDLVLSLNAYFDKMVSLIMKSHGTVDKFIGDAIMAIFGAPVIREDDAENAVEVSILMMDALQQFNQEQDVKGMTNFKIGVGINTGHAIVGNIGSEQKIEYTVIGDTVNLASRLEGLTKKYHVPVIISEFTRDRVSSDRFFFREIDNVRVKGKNKPVKILQPMMKEKVENKLAYFAKYHEALKLYINGDFSSAKKIFKQLSIQDKDDYLCQMYDERCQHLIKYPPDNWDGVETWTEK